MVAYLGYTLRMRTLFRGWPIMVNDTHTRRRSTDVFKYSFFPRIITGWNSLPLAVRLWQSTQSFHEALQNSASANRCWLSWHSSGNGWSAPIAGHRTEEPKNAVYRCLVAGQLYPSCGFSLANCRCFKFPSLVGKFMQQPLCITALIDRDFLIRITSSCKIFMI